MDVEGDKSEQWKQWKTSKMKSGPVKVKHVSRFEPESDLILDTDK